MRPKGFPSLLALVVFAVAATVGACTAKAPIALHDLPEQTDASIQTMLDHVPTVATRPNPAGYERDCGRGHGCVFGPAWTDDHHGTGGHNGCDTRNDILAKQLTEVVFRPGSKQCVVTSGVLRDPYTGALIHFTKADASAVQIDHIFPLSLAWDMGANNWSKERRVDFANDQENLLAVDGPTNMSKGDSGPAEWLPINARYRCTYVKRFLELALGYQLPITRADAASVRVTATHCS